MALQDNMECLIVFRIPPQGAFNTVVGILTTEAWKVLPAEWKSGATLELRSGFHPDNPRLDREGKVTYNLNQGSFENPTFVEKTVDLAHRYYWDHYILEASWNNKFGVEFSNPRVDSLKYIRGVPDMQRAVQNLAMGRAKASEFYNEQHWILVPRRQMELNID